MSTPPVDSPADEPVRPAGGVPSGYEPTRRPDDVPRADAPVRPAGDVPSGYEPARRAGDVPRADEPVRPAGDVPSGYEPARRAGDAPAADEPVGPADGLATSGAEAVGEAERAAARRRERAVSGTLAAGLILEGITVLFVPLAIARIGADGISGTQLTLLLLLAAALFAAAGLQRRRVGLVLASALQLAVIATGLMIPTMYFLGLLFTGVWAYLLWVRQEVARAAARAAPG
jgi:hypothetical protein